ncbi:uncharacterized protein LOC123913512 [Trifolium pratense]|uniref:uncharacterized protein LOC123913512 n=1 Tax=Trifolium pratense TaxID=57577 RepID=UPI001E6901A6|nr:uncharacterized protein LOC123913512 [Trifolium pratense]
MAKEDLSVLTIAFSSLGALMLPIFLFTFLIEGFPFRKQILNPWMIATLTEFYINAIIFSVWVAYKEANWITSIIWVMLLICFGSIATCAYIVVQILKLTPSQESSDHMYYIMLRYVYRNTTVENGTELKTKYSFVLTLRIFFSILGAVMIGTLVYTLVTDGSPFRKELSTLWMLATLAGFYINVLALIVWVSYKESSCICTVFWIVLFVCFGSVATCAYMLYGSCSRYLVLILLTLF